MLPQLKFHKISSWPKLAWVAKMNLETGIIDVVHGPNLEIFDDWCAEMVWDLPFESGDFDQSDCVIGSGIRLRGDRVIFVNSSDTLSRIQFTQLQNDLFVSNSIAALLAIADVDFVNEFDYATALSEVSNGISPGKFEIPTTKSKIRVVYFYNIEVKGKQITEIHKPKIARSFNNFTSYRNFLQQQSKSIMENASCPARIHKISGLATCSRGYDSPATSLLAFDAGVANAVTIRKARRAPGSLYDLDDSGVDIAKHIGLNCKSYERERATYPYEDAIWSALGKVGDLNLTVFDFPGPVCLLWCGFGAGKIWAKSTPDFQFLSRSLPTDSSGIRFCEARLELGVLLCSPPLWAPYQREQIQGINFMDEMKPWRLSQEYDRPIPRRMLEEIGVKRSSFGTRKKASSFNRVYGAPLSFDLREDFFKFMIRRKHKPITEPLEYLSLVFRALDSLVLEKLPRPIRFSCRHWIKLPQPNDFFLWANQRRKNRFAAHLHQDTSQVSTTPPRT